MLFLVACTPEVTTEGAASPRRTDDPVAATTEERASARVGGPTRPADAVGPLRVLNVVDGDTIRVEIDGESVPIRIIGIDTPETRDPRKPVQCFGREATAQAEALLVDGQVWLTHDPTQDLYDRYDRLLAYVWLPDGRLFEWVMVAEGFAHEYTYEVPYEYQSDLQAAEVEAREQDRGLWDPGTCAGDTTAAAE